MHAWSPSITSSATDPSHVSSHFHPLRISSIKPADTDQAVAIVFDVPEELEDTFKFTQGQYLTLRKEIDGEELRRSYSICAGLNDGQLRVGVKLVEGGVFSSWAHGTLKEGDVVEVMPPQGNFFSELDPERERWYMCICAGSGITPVLSIIKTVLSLEPRSHVTLLYGNQRTASMMFRNELAFLKNKFMSRLHWINVFSREPQESDLFSGHLDNRKGGLLNQRLINISEHDEFFLCGPEAMISEVSRGLRGEGVAEEHIHYELFGSSAEDARRAVEKHHARALEHKGLVSDVSVISHGREYRFELSADGGNILDAGLENGVDLPFSCKGGVCATCKAKLVEGEVDMDRNQALQADEIAQGFILTCQSHPISRRVVVDYDHI
jgi:ring-1,2-phenylacetyl-CoA epoxidase subunit PaaE